MKPDFKPGDVLLVHDGLDSQPFHLKVTEIGFRESLGCYCVMGFESGEQSPISVPARLVVGKLSPLEI
jgi:hypothetical protein